MCKDFRVVKSYLSDGYVLVFRNARGEVFYLCDLNKRLDINEILVCNGKAFVLTKNIEFAMITDSFTKAMSIQKSFLEFDRENNFTLEYTCGIGKLYLDANVIVEC